MYITGFLELVKSCGVRPAFDDFDVFGGEDGVERGRILGVTIMDEEPARGCPNAEVG